MKYKLFFKNSETNEVLEKIFTYVLIFNGAARSFLNGLGTNWALVDTMKSCGLHTLDKRQEIFENDIFIYMEHEKYQRKTFVGRMVWMEDYGCFGYEKAELFDDIGLAVPLAVHVELQEYFLNHIEIVGNVYKCPLEYTNYFIDVTNN